MKWRIPGNQVSAIDRVPFGDRKDFEVFAVRLGTAEDHLVVNLARGPYYGHRSHYLVQHAPSSPDLGGYVGLSYHTVGGRDVWHVGTPAWAFSEPLASLAQRLGWTEVGSITPAARRWVVTNSSGCAVAVYESPTGDDHDAVEIPIGSEAAFAAITWEYFHAAFWPSRAAIDAANADQQLSWSEFDLLYNSETARAQLDGRGLTNYHNDKMAREMTRDKAHLAARMLCRAAGHDMPEEAGVSLVMSAHPMHADPGVPLIIRDDMLNGEFLPYETWRQVLPLLSRQANGLLAARVYPAANSYYARHFEYPSFRSVEGFDYAYSYQAGRFHASILHHPTIWSDGTVTVTETDKDQFRVEFAPDTTWYIARQHYSAYQHETRDSWWWGGNPPADYCEFRVA